MNHWYYLLPLILAGLVVLLAIFAYITIIQFNGPHRNYCVCDAYRDGYFGHYGILKRRRFLIWSYWVKVDQRWEKHQAEEYVKHLT